MNVREISASRTRAQALNRLRLADSVFRVLTRGAAVGVLIILGGVILSLFLGSLPALQAFGLDFLIEERWNPVTEKFGALAPIYGTIVTSLIAMLIAVPVGLLIAVFLTELCPLWLRRPIGIAIELLAGGQPIDAELVRQTIAQQLDKIRRLIGASRFDSGSFEPASRLFEKITISDDFPEFLTLPAYELLD